MGWNTEWRAISVLHTLATYNGTYLLVTQYLVSSVRNWSTSSCFTIIHRCKYSEDLKFWKYRKYYLQYWARPKSRHQWKQNTKSVCDNVWLYDMCHRIWFDIHKYQISPKDWIRRLFSPISHKIYTTYLRGFKTSFNKVTRINSESAFTFIPSSLPMNVRCRMLRYYYEMFIYLMSPIITLTKAYSIRLRNTKNVQEDMNMSMAWNTKLHQTCKRCSMRH